MTTCTCRAILLKGEDTGSRSLDPDCPEHGENSSWYNCPEQVAHRADRSKRLHDLYEQAKLARSLP